MSDCLFCKMVNGEIEPDVVYEDDAVLAFRDVNPQAPTHVLVIPKQHVATTNDLDAGNAGLGAAGMIKEGQVAFPHVIAQEVAGLVVAHPVPVFGAFRPGLEMFKAKAVRLGFHQPVVHRLIE